MTDLAATLRAASIGHTIAAWSLVNHIGQSELARQMGVSAAFMSAVVNDRKTLPDDRIALLPDGLRQQVAEIRARRYEGLAAIVRHSVGIKREPAP